MIVDEREMLEVCEKYGIPVIEKEGYPLDMGVEMDDSFSAELMMKEPSSFVIEERILLSQLLELSVSVFINEKQNRNFSGLRSDEIIIEKAEYDEQPLSNHFYENDYEYAA